MWHRRAQQVAENLNDEDSRPLQNVNNVLLVPSPSSRAGCSILSPLCWRVLVRSSTSKFGCKLFSRNACNDENLRPTDGTDWDWHPIPRADTNTLRVFPAEAFWAGANDFADGRALHYRRADRGCLYGNCSLPLFLP